MITDATSETLRTDPILVQLRENVARSFGTTTDQVSDEVFIMLLNILTPSLLRMFDEALQPHRQAA